MCFIVHGYLSNELVLCEWLELMNFAGKIIVIRRRMDEIIKENVKRELVEIAPVYQRVCYLEVCL